MGNIMLGENTYFKELEEYFNLSENIVCVNAIGNNIQQKLNGCDYDSDSMLVTSDAMIVRSAYGSYGALGVPVCCIAPSGKADYKNTPTDIARLDGVIANNKIGEIVNIVTGEKITPEPVPEMRGWGWGRRTEPPTKFKVKLPAHSYAAFSFNK
jgi:hypothetical protein